MFEGKASRNYLTKERLLKLLFLCLHAAIAEYTVHICIIFVVNSQKFVHMCMLPNVHICEISPPKI